MEWREAPRAWHGRLLTAAEQARSPERGQPVHAGSWIRKRQIILDTELTRNPAELSRILVHELFHFAWVRLSNGTRNSWGKLLEAEIGRGARGELGWSAESRKNEIVARGGFVGRRRWREYACESFCDTAAWMYAWSGGHEEFTLARRWCDARRRWFEELEVRTPAGLRV